MHRSRKSFKETLNAGGREKQTKAGSKPFVIKAHSLGLRADLDPTGFNKLADDLEVDVFLEKRRRAKGD